MNTPKKAYINNNVYEKYASTFYNRHGETFNFSSDIF